MTWQRLSLGFLLATGVGALFFTPPDRATSADLAPAPDGLLEALNGQGAAAPKGVAAPTAEPEGATEVADVTLRSSRDILADLELLNPNDSESLYALLDESLALHDKEPFREFLEDAMATEAEKLAARGGEDRKRKLLQLAYYYGLSFPNDAEVGDAKKNEILELVAQVPDPRFQLRIQGSLRGAVYERASVSSP